MRRVVFTVINLKQQQSLLFKKRKYDGKLLPDTCFMFKKQPQIGGGYRWSPGRLRRAVPLSPQSGFRVTTVARMCSQSDVSSAATDEFTGNEVEVSGLK